MNTKKTTISILMVIVLLFSLTITAFADNSSGSPLTTAKLQSSIETKSNTIKNELNSSVIMYVGSPHAYVDNVYVDLDIRNSKIVPIMRNNEVLVPLQFVSDAFKCKLSYDSQNKVFTLIKGINKAEIKPGSRECIINGLNVPIATPIVTINDRIYVPLTPLVESVLGKKMTLVNGLAVVSEKDSVIDYTNNTEVTNKLIQELSAKLGNTVGNLCNGGNAVQDGEYIYYASFDYNHSNYGASKIYRCKLDGSQVKIVTTGYCIDNLNISDGWIYYTGLDKANDWENGNFYKVKTDGTKKTKITKDKIRPFYVNIIGDRIYFRNGGENKLYWMKTDGSNKTFILDDEKAYLFTVVGNKIYYDSYEPKSIDIDGTNETEIFDDHLDNGYLQYYVVSNGYAYAVQENPDNHNSPSDRIVKVNLWDKSLTVLKNIKEFTSTYSINVQGEWIYYNEGGEIRRMKIDGTDDKPVFKVKDYPVWHINVAGDWVFYDLAGSGRGMYKVKLDGTSNQKLK